MLKKEDIFEDEVKYIGSLRLDITGLYSKDIFAIASTLKTLGAGVQWTWWRRYYHQQLSINHSRIGTTMQFGLFVC